MITRDVNHDKYFKYFGVTFFLRCRDQNCVMKRDMQIKVGFLVRLFSPSNMVVAHSEILLSKCALFRELGEFIDVRLKVCDNEFPAHRIVLAANSDYFHAMFAHGMKESNQEVIELKDENISAAALKIVMDAIYSGEINVNDENVFEVLPAADHLQVTSVIQQCCDYLQTEFVHQKFDLQTYCHICRIADRHGLNDLKESTQHEIALIFNEICESEEFLSHIDADQLLSLLSRDDLNAPTENFVFKSVMQWIKYKKEERMGVAAKVIGAVRLGLVDIKDVIKELDTEEMQGKPEIQSLLHQSLLYSHVPSRSTFGDEKAKLRSSGTVRIVFSFLVFPPNIYSDLNREDYLLCSLMSINGYRCANEVITLKASSIDPIQGFWQSARVRSRTIDQKSHYFALFAFSRTLPHFSRLFAKKTHKLQN